MTITNSTHKPDQEQALQDLWLKECDEFEQLKNIQAGSLSDAFALCFKLRKWNSERFMKATGLGDAFFSRIGTGKYDDKMRPSLASVVAICIGLHIPFKFSNILIMRCGHSLTDSKQDCCYAFILSHYEMFKTVEDANQFLVDKGFSPIINKDNQEK